MNYTETKKKEEEKILTKGGDDAVSVMSHFNNFSLRLENIPWSIKFSELYSIREVFEKKIKRFSKIQDQIQKLLIAEQSNSIGPGERAPFTQVMKF